jgi:polysaccharide pyruvyl transferase WcaK-like protein
MDVDCVVSERAFVAVSALSLGIPSIILDRYGGKSIGLAKLFDFDKFACGIESFNATSIISWIEDILENEEQYSIFLQRKAEELYNIAVTKTWRLIQASQ